MIVVNTMYRAGVFVSYAVLTGLNLPAHGICSYQDERRTGDVPGKLYSPSTQAAVRPSLRRARWTTF